MNFVGGTNPKNAIVQLAGLRLSPSEYTIDSFSNTIMFNDAPPNVDIEITTFNDTNRQYMVTQSGIIGNVVSPIATINNVLSPPLATTLATATTVTTNLITVASVDNFIVDQPVQFYGIASMGGVLVDGTVYFIDTIDTIDNKFTIKNAAGTQIVLTNSTGSLTTVVGGVSTTRVTVATGNNLFTNDVIRIDGTSGSVQLNNNTYYVHVINAYVVDTVDLYLQPYDPAPGAVNFPVTNITTYTGGGFIWENNIFNIQSAVASATTLSDSTITVDSTDNLIENTPVYFTQFGSVTGETILGGLIQGTEYYVKTVVSGTKFTVSEARDGIAFAVTTDTGTVNVSQWLQVDVDRLWVTINGFRVPSSKLRINDPNEISILSEILTGDEVIITSMMPSASPNQEVYLNFVNASNEQTIYRAETETRTWLTQPIFELTTEIFIDDVGVLGAGDLIIINGEMIKFTDVNTETNSLTGLSRGVNGTAKQSFIPIYTEVYGLISANKLPEMYYDQTWNSNVWNSVSGDPLQISDTIPARFLILDERE